MQMGEGVRAMMLLLASRRTMISYIYKDPQNKDEQFIECLECPTCISATIFKYRYDYQLLLL